MSPFSQPAARSRFEIVRKVGFDVYFVTPSGERTRVATNYSSGHYIGTPPEAELKKLGLDQEEVRLFATIEYATAYAAWVGAASLAELQEMLYVKMIALSGQEEPTDETNVVLFEPDIDESVKEAAPLAPETDQDARLIAAAPDLLAALKESLPCLQMPLWSVAAAAIAKAEAEPEEPPEGSEINPENPPW